MKKILSFALVGLMGLNLVSCNEKGASGNAASGSMVDSVSMIMGKMMANYFAPQLKGDSTVKMDQVVKGVETSLRNDTANHGYMVGLQLGTTIQNQFMMMAQQYHLTLNQRVFMDNFKKVLLADSALNQQEVESMNQEMDALLRRAMAQSKANDPVAQKNKADGEAFAKKKAAEPGYQKTASGIVYKVLTEGQGENFTEKDVVMTKYRGLHIDGKEFDSSGDETVPFSMAGVIPGFSEVLKLMKPGMKVECIIPGDLAYGPEGREPTIGSNETLVFELETVGVKQQDTLKGAQKAK